MTASLQPTPGASCSASAPATPRRRRATTPRMRRSRRTSTSSTAAESPCTGGRSRPSARGCSNSRYDGAHRPAAAPVPHHARAHPRRRACCSGLTCCSPPSRRSSSVPTADDTRAAGRAAVANPYLRLRNYRASLERLGFTTADMANDGSDRLIDALVAHGDADHVASRLRAHSRRRRRPRRGAGAACG